MKITPDKIYGFKFKSRKIAALAAYDFSTAKYFDEAGIDLILVGDSLAMTALGYENTFEVGLEEMKIFTRAVARGVKNALVVADMPFMTAAVSVETALKNAAEFIRAGAGAVKIEGGSNYTVEIVKRLTDSGIPVMAHLGFTPQYLNTLGGYKVQGKNLEGIKVILDASKKLEQAGAFCLVLEMMSEEGAKYISENIHMPTLGIGAGRFVDGQILVGDDILGKFDAFTPKFARKYADMKSLIFNAASKYAKDVRDENFPAESEIFHLKEEEKNELENYSYNSRNAGVCQN